MFYFVRIFLKGNLNKFLNPAKIAKEEEGAKCPPCSQAPQPLADRPPLDIFEPLSHATPNGADPAPPPWGGNPPLCVWGWVQGGGYYVTHILSHNHNFADFLHYFLVSPDRMICPPPWDGPFLGAKLPHLVLGDCVFQLAVGFFRPSSLPVNDYVTV